MVRFSSLRFHAASEVSLVQAPEVARGCENWLRKVRQWFGGVPGTASRHGLPKRRTGLTKVSRRRRRTRLEPLEERVLLSNDVLVGLGEVYGQRGQIELNQVDDYTQTDGGTLEVEISSPTSFDRLQIAGAATLDGRLRVLVDPSYEPQEGDTFPILQLASPADGNFSDWEGVQLTSRFRLVPVLGPQSLQLVVSQTSNEVAFRAGTTTAANQIATAIGGGTGSIVLTDVELSLSAFVHVRGSFSFQKHATERVTLATGLPQNLGEAQAAEPVREYLETLIQTASAADSTITVSDNLSQIFNWPVSMMTFGAADADVFVGMGRPDLSDPAWDQDGDLFGFAFRDVDFAFAWAWTANPSLLLPGAFNPLQSFFGATLSAESGQLLGGGDILELQGSGFELQWNDNFGRWPLNMGPAVIDWQTSYPTTSGGAMGKPVATGGTDANGNPQYLYIAHDGNQRLGVGVEHARAVMADFVYVEGSLYFERSPQQKVTLATGLPQNLGESAAAAWLQPFVDAVASAGLGIEFPETDSLTGLPIPRYSRITGWDVATTYIGGSDLNVFVGYGNPNFDDPDWVHADGLYGFGFANVDFGFAMMKSTTPSELLGPIGDALDTFYAATMTADTAAVVGFGNLLDLDVTGLELQWNDNFGRWPLDMGPAVVDWQYSFPAEDRDFDGTPEPAGKYIRTGARIDAFTEKYVNLAHDGNQRLGLGIQHANLVMAEFVYASGSMYFEKGPQQKITIATGLPQNLGESLAAQAVQPFIDAVASAGLGIEFPETDSLTGLP
ncbi:MAG: hypothetical protein RLZZ458_845, partial [Planctomycetota bacterium]